jgi:rSAM/selenodomain-associated transferase 2
MGDSDLGTNVLRISVVIPVLNEVGCVGASLRQFGCVEEGVDLIVVDGGSADGTREVVLETGVARLIDSDRGRAAQMNAGAAAADGDVLLFLHADGVLPAGWVEMVRDALADERAVGGRFRLALSEGGVLFALIAWMSTVRSRYLGITYGDQGIFARRTAFEKVSGFPDRRIFEDSEFCRDLSRQGRFVMVKASLTTSTRRWRQWGIVGTVLRMWWLRVLYSLSVSDERLSRMYKDVR